jgi:hypothetical protein
MSGARGAGLTVGGPDGRGMRVERRVLSAMAAPSSAERLHTKGESGRKDFTCDARSSAAKSG